MSDAPKVTIDDIWKNVRESVRLHVNSTAVQIMSAFDKDTINVLIPDTDALDRDLDARLNRFNCTDDPSFDMMIDGAASVYTIAIMELVMEHFDMFKDAADGRERDAAAAAEEEEHERQLDELADDEIDADYEEEDEERPHANLKIFPNMTNWARELFKSARLASLP